MTDYIVRATAADSQIRAFAATTREMTEYARKVHEESPSYLPLVHPKAIRLYWKIRIPSRN